MRMKDVLGTLGNMSYRKPAQPGLNKTERSLLTLVTECLQVNSMAGSGCSDVIRAHFFPLVLLASLQRFCVPQWRLSQWWGSAGGLRYTLYLRFMISQEQLAEFEYAKLGKITQVLVYLVILEPNSETWGIMEYSDSPGLPGSWASRGGIVGTSPSEHHGTNSK